MDSNSTLSFEEIDVDEIRPNRYNPNRMTDRQLQALKRTIRKEGFCGVILVRRTRNGFVIVDGEHRWRAAQELGIKRAPCLVGEFDEAQARALTIKMNQIHGYWSAPELVSLLDELPDSLDDLGFSDHEFTCEIERALGDVSIGEEIDTQLSGTTARKHHGSRTYVGFMLSNRQQRLLERALKHAFRLEGDNSQSRSDTLGQILTDYLKHHKKYM